MELISIITPVYNCKDYIFTTINSVINQDYENWEYIIVDDCSTDGTLSAIRNMYNDPRIKIIESSKNGGAGLARNLALEKAKGRYIAFLDSDDIWNKDKLIKQISFMKKHNYPIVHTSYSFINEQGDSIPGRVNVSNVVNLNSYMRNTEIGLSTSLIDKNIVGEIFFDLMRTRQDTNLWLILLSKGFNSYGLDENLVLYRVRSGQISGNKLLIAYKTFKLYISFSAIPIHHRIINFVFYAFNGFFKRLRK